MATTKKKATTKTAAVKEAEPKTAAEIEEIEYKQEQEQAAEVSAAISADVPNTVTVAMNYPCDLDFHVNINGREVHQIIKGNSGHLRGKAQGILPTGGQFGLTFGVDADLWAAIEKQYSRPDNGLHGLFDNGLIFATKPGTARAAAAERKETRHGMEPIDPNNTHTTAAN